MARLRSIALKPVTLLLGASIVVAAGARAAPTCVEVSSHAFYRALGYDHVVHLANRCGKSATCNVSTDVNPAPISVKVAASEEVDVLTFRGSPARAFVAHVTCEVAK